MTDEAPRGDQAHLVLIVDDAEDHRFLYRVGLEKAGFNVEDAEDGEAALAKLADIRPAVIIMDLTMPKMDGWEATRRIKSNPATKDIIVIVVSGSGTPAEVERAWASGADDVCKKPCPPAALLEKVRALLARRGETATTTG